MGRYRSVVARTTKERKVAATAGAAAANAEMIVMLEENLNALEDRCIKVVERSTNKRTGFNLCTYIHYQIRNRKGNTV